jgi:hypothetical protein
MAATPPSRWIKFLRNYGPIPTNDNMYDETIQRALGRLKIEPLVLPAQFLDQVLTNLRSSNPCSEILTGTAGDGKTYHSREVWTALGGSETEWNRGGKVQKLSVDGRDLVVIKDLSELGADGDGTRTPPRQSWDPANRRRVWNPRRASPVRTRGVNRVSKGASKAADRQNIQCGVPTRAARSCNCGTAVRPPVNHLIQIVLWSRRTELK